jgi:hypothetical protein
MIYPMSRYYKIYQRDQYWHYVKLMEDRMPKAAQVINFLNPVPQIYFQEFDLAIAASVIEYQALTASATPIQESEYEQAFQQATKEIFEVYIDGKKQ